MPTGHLIMFKDDFRGYIFYPPFTHMLGFLYTFHFIYYSYSVLLGLLHWHCNDLALQRRHYLTMPTYIHSGDLPLSFEVLKIRNKGLSP